MNPQVEEVVRCYPKEIESKIVQLRGLIMDVAKKSDIKLTETLKWNEPSYLCDNGSTIRLAWKKSSPMYYGLYFNCKTRLVETIKEIYPADFTYEGKRAIIFELNQDIPENKLKHCIEFALNYHLIKHLPLFGL